MVSGIVVGQASHENKTTKFENLMVKHHSQSVEFGSFRMDLENQQLWNGDALIRIRPKAWSVLLKLVNNAGKLVTKQELIESVWAGGHVTNTALRVCIREIRMTLDAHSKDEQFIETQGTIGYRFVSSVKSYSTFPSQTYTKEYMVGRAPELSRLDESFEKVLAGARQCVLVFGDAGSGKTTLIEDFVSRLSTSNIVFMGLGQCVEQFSEGEPYRPIFEALGRICRGPFGAEMIQLLKKHAPSCLQQMPALLSSQELEDIRIRTADSGEGRLLRELCEAFEHISKIRPLVIVIEDLHWSDAATIDLVTTLARRREPSRLLVLGTSRPLTSLQFSHPLVSARYELNLHNLCDEIPLDLLSQKSTHEYLARRFFNAAGMSKLAELIYLKGGGNPLFMVNAANMVEDCGYVVKTNGRYVVEADEQALNDFEISVPDSLLKIITHQVRQLRNQQQALLRCASIAGLRFTVASVSACTSQASLADLEYEFEELALTCPFIVAQGLVEWPDGASSSAYSFSHAMYQSVIYKQVAPARRIKLHKLVGERLEQAYGADTKELASELAVHFTQGRDSAKAMRYLHQAGVSAYERNAPKQALEYLTQSLAKLQELPESLVLKKIVEI